jgi:beta-galactosidase
MGNGPGALDQYEALVHRFPRLHGGFIWEWRDHGILTTAPDGTSYYGYGGDFGEVVHDGNFVMDGMVLSNDVPTPGLHEYKAVVQPVGFAFGPGTVELTNRRHSADTADLRFRWNVTHDGHVVASGDLDVAPIEAGSSAVVALPPIPVAGGPEVPASDGEPSSESAAADSEASSKAAASGDAAMSSRATSSGLPPAYETWLTIEAVLAEEAAWAPAGHVVAAAQLDCTANRPAPVAGRAPVWERGEGTVTLGSAEFDRGTLVRLAGRTMAGPRLELFRAPTDNDEGTSGNPAESDGSLPGVSNASLWRRAGLDRLTTRVVSVATAPGALRVVSRVAPANSGQSVTVETIWRAVGDELDLRVSIEPSRGWSTVWPRIGLRFDFPDDGDAVDGAAWFGTGPLESYPDSRHAALVGRFESGIDDLSVDYARPQETGHRADLRSIVLRTRGDDALRIDTIPDTRGRRPGFTLTRHTPQEVAAAAHPHELPPSTTTYLFLDAAQHGLGSRACGPDVWPDFALRPEARTIHVRLRPIGGGQPSS